MPTLALRGKSALITGASRGIGAAIALELAAEGAQLIVNFRDRADRAASVVEAIKDRGGSAQAVQADVRSLEDCEKMFSHLATQGITADILVNNAGIARDRTYQKMQVEEWDDVLQTNLMGVEHCTRLALPGMVAGKYGRIVNVSSFIGQIGEFGQTNYATAKAAVIGFTKALSLEVAKHNITVNAVCPGYVRTDMWDSILPAIQERILRSIPAGRLAEPAEIGACVRYLVVQGAYITGQTININGGVYRGG